MRADLLRESLHGVVAPTASRSTLSRATARGELVRLTHGAFVIPGLADALTVTTAALLTYPMAVASHRAAAYVWGLDGISEPHPDITVPYAAAPTIGTAHRSNDLEAFEVREVDGLRVTDPTRTLVDLGAVCREQVVERALESALWRGLTSVKRLEWRLNALSRPGRRGPPVLREVLRRRPAGAATTESELETRYLQCLRDHGVPLPVRQYRVVHDGRLLGRLDMAYPDEKVFVELDGWEHHGSRHAFERDRARQNDMVAAGWAPLRFTWTDVTDEPGQTAERTLSVLTWSSSCSPCAAEPT